MEDFNHVRIFYEIATERMRQDRIWGKQNHTPREWLSILAEEFGEVARAVRRDYFGSDKDYGDYRTELIHVAAVAVAMIENFDENEGKK